MAQMTRILTTLIVLLMAMPVAAAQFPTREEFLNLARQGWVFEMRSNVRRRDHTMPAVRTNSRAMVAGSICLYGEPVHPHLMDVFTTFRNLINAVYGQVGTLQFGQKEAPSCAGTPRIFVRFYSGRPPHRAFNADLRHVDEVYDIDLPQDRDQPILGPAQAATFFGREGTASHLLINQPGDAPLTQLQRQYYRTLLIEELFHAFTFGMDILKFDRKTAFRSKLQEHPVNLRYLAWDSPKFMRGLLASNPKGLCAFDIFMMHALANTALDSVNTQEFLRFISAHFDRLEGLTRATLADARFNLLMDNRCRDLPA